MFFLSLAWGEFASRLQVDQPRDKVSQLNWFLVMGKPYLLLHRYIYWLFPGADGNYSLQKKTKPGNDTDYSLVGDNGFFNNVNKLYNFLKKYPKEHWIIVSTST